MPPHARVVGTAVFSGLFAASMLVFLAGFLVGVGPLRLAGLLGAVFFGVGGAPTQLSGTANLTTRFGIAGITGFSMLTLVGSLMALAPLWHPALAAAAVGAAATAAHAAAVRRELPEAGRAWQSLRSRSPDWRRILDPSIACAITGTALWAGAALAVGRVSPGVGGFLPRISVLWYLGLLMLLAGIVLAHGKSEIRALTPLVSLVVAVTATPALAYGMPRSQSAGKHADMVQQILVTHHLDPGSGIYQAYSGFFSAIAWLCDVAAVRDVIGLATWWPLVVGLVALVELRFVYGRLIRSSYRISMGMTLAVLANAIGADYFSPQSLGFVLGLGVYGLALGRRCRGVSNRDRVALLVLAGCALAVAHELSPYIVGGVLTLLVLFRASRPWYLPATSLIPAGMWAAFNRPVLSGYVSFAFLGDMSNFAPPRTVASPGLHRLPIVNESSYALLAGILVLIVLGGVGALRMVRRGQTYGFVAAAGVGIFVMVVNPYGNEGIFRTALFGIPWLAALATMAVPTSRPKWVSIAFGCLASGMLATYLIAMFGLDNENVIRPSDLQALRVYQAQAPPSSYILNLSNGDVPNSVTFPDGGHFLGWDTMLERADVLPGHPNAADVSALTERYIRYVDQQGGAGAQLYAFYSPASAANAVDYGLETPEQTRAWPALMAADPHWLLVFRSDGTYLFRFAQPAGS